MGLLSGCGTTRELGGSISKRAYAPAGKNYDYRRDRSIEGAAGMKEESVEDESVESKSPAESEKKPEAPRVRMVIYEADLALNVESVKKTLDALNALALRMDGYVQSATTSDSYRQAVIVIRVPVAKFEQALDEIQKMGSVLRKSVSAQDVTMEFSDLSLRVETARKVRERFYELLKRTTKVEDRVKILKEIERLTQVIESLSARMQSLGDRAAYSTLTVHLSAKVADTVKTFLPSPFPWIAGLSPDRRTIFGAPAKYEYKTPGGFFNLEENFNRNRGTFLFSSPDGGAGVRMGVVENYPPADLKFWDQAFVLEMNNRMYKPFKSDELKSDRGLEMKHYLYRLTTGAVYGVSLHVGAGGILVAEAVYRNEESFRKSHEAVEKFLNSLGAKK